MLLWAMAIMASKGLTTARENQLLEADLVPVTDGVRILPEDSREYARQVESLPTNQQRLLLPRVVLAALRRFGATGSIQDASDTAHSTAETEAEEFADIYELDVTVLPTNVGGSFLASWLKGSSSARQKGRSSGCSSPRAITRARDARSTAAGTGIRR